MFSGLFCSSGAKKSKTPVTFWWDPMSQPCRAVKFALEKVGAEVTERRIQVVKDTRSEDFKANVNEDGTVPVIEHDDTKIYESASILRYVCDSFQGCEHLYPRKCLKSRAKVDYWLDWNGNTGRTAFSGAFVEIVMAPKFFGAPEPSQARKDELYEKLNSALGFIEKKLSGKAYLTGDYLTIADVQVYNEVLECKTILEYDISAYPNVQNWINNVGSDCVVKELDEMFYARLKE